MIKKTKKLFLIDGQGLVYRSFFALPKLTTTYGLLINAAYGFTLVLMRLLEEQKPDGLVIAFDTPQPTFRHQRYPSYKAQREKMPRELIDQLPLIQEIVHKMNILSISVAEYEADDIIGSIAVQAKNSPYRTVIVTGDRDLLQLIDEDTEILFMQKGISQVKHYQLDSAKSMLGFHPDLIPDYIGLKGDSSDNIPGIPGIGEKTARDLIQHYGSLENIIQHASEVKNKSLRAKIERYDQQATLSKELAVIRRDMNLNIEFQHLNYKGPDYQQLRELFQKYEFKKLLEKIPRQETADQKENKGPAIYALRNEQDLEVLSHKIKSTGAFSFFFGINCLSATKKDVRSITFAVDNDIFLANIACHDRLIAEQHHLSANVINKFLFALFQDKKIEKIGYDLKNVWTYLGDNGIFLELPYFDILIAAYLLNPSQQEFSLTKIIQNFLPEEPSVKNSSSLKEEKIEAEDRESCCLVKLFLPLKSRLEAQLTEKNLLNLYQKIELPLVRVIYQMEKKGIKLDTVLLKRMSQEFSEKIATIKNEIFQIAGEEFNLNSPRQLSQILFQKLKLPVIKKIKTGFSTNAQVLNQLSEKHEIVAKILDHRELEKLKNTYIDKLPKLIHPKTGRIHTSFNQTGTSTGRLSSNNPNLQNIPIRTALGKSIRNAFIAEKENIYLSADYSQIELRILAHLSQDKSLLDAFSGDKDIHSFTASQIFNVDQDIVSEEMRRIAKTINFGIIYGMSSYGLASSLGISREEAQQYIEAYFQRYQQVKVYIDQQIITARKKKYVKTMLNRIRYLDGIDSTNRGVREFCERIAVNTPIQGTAADLIKIAMIKITEELEREGRQSGLILQIHDELIFEFLVSELEERREIIKEIMENSLKLSVPLKVNFKTGCRWGELE